MAMNEEDKEILTDFINEGSEGIEKAELSLLQLDKQLATATKIEPNIIDSVFRVFHSIKGSAGFLGLNLINQITHKAESLLDNIRKGKVAIQKKHIDIFLEVCDVLQLLLDYLKENSTEEGFKTDISELIGRLEGFAQNRSAPIPQEKTEPLKENSRQKESIKFNTEMLITDEMKKEFVDESSELLDQLEQDLMELEKAPKSMSLLESAFRSLHSIKGNAGFMGYADINEVAHQAETIFDLARSESIVLESRQISLILQMLDFMRTALEALKNGKPPIIAGKLAIINLMEDMVNAPLKKEVAGKTLPQSVQNSAEKNKESLPAVADGPQSSSFKKSLSNVIRVDVNKLNHLMDLVGEIVIAESMVANHPEIKEQEIESLGKAIFYLQKNVRELQDLATSMRMIPLSGIFGKMRRLVRDISAKKGKKVELIIRGGETEVDRSIIEHVSDPLIHILRNAIDHGIEDPSERKAAGKAEHGTVLLEAQRIGGEIWILIQDDGQGLNKEKIVKRAKEKGMLDDDSPLSDEAIYQLIFKPGFSTAEKVTNISGRGVGMDVVQKNVQKIRGKIELSSKPGKGTTIYLKIPLTAAIIDGMLLRVGSLLYAVPILDIKETLRVNANQAIDLIDGQEIIKVRQQIIPVIRLQQLHNTMGDVTPIEQGIVVVSEAAGKNIGFLVDEILGQQQLVIKPLPKYLGKLEGVSGCAILGNGDICLILDLSTMLKMVGLVSMI